MKEKSRPVYVKAYQPWNMLIPEIISIPLAPVLAALKVHPNLITFLSLLAGLVNGVFFARGQWIWGAVFFEFSFFCDNIDGKVARLREISSEFGGKLDNMADAVRKPSAFLGIAIFFYINSGMLLAILTAVVLVVHVVVHKLYGKAGVLAFDLEFPNFHRKVVRRFIPRSLALYTFDDEQLMEFVIFPLIGGLIGLPEGGVWFFYGMIAGTLLSLGKLCILLNHRRKGRYEQVYQDWPGTKGMLDKA